VSDCRDKENEISDDGSKAAGPPSRDSMTGQVINSESLP
jgi:hypothetical protein